MPTRIVAVETDGNRSQIRLLVRLKLYRIKPTIFVWLLLEDYIVNDLTWFFLGKH